MQQTKNDSGRVQILDENTERITCPNCHGTKSVMIDGAVTECHECAGDGTVDEKTIVFRREGTR